MTPERRAQLMALAGDSETPTTQSDAGFDLSTAKPVVDDGFDISTAKPVEATSIPPSKDSPSFMEQLGALHPAPLGPALKEYPRVAANAASAVTLGTVPPDAFLGGESFSKYFPPIESMRGKATNLVGQGATYAAGLPGQAGTAVYKAASAMLPKNLLGLVGSGAVSGAVGAGLTNVGDPQSIPGNVQAGGIVGGLAAPVAQLAGDIYRVTNVPLRAKFVNSVRQAFLNSKKLAGENFGLKLDVLAEKNPTQMVDLSDMIADVQQRSMNNPAFKSLVMRSVKNDQESALMQSIINQPETAMNLTIKDAQALKQVFGRALKQKFGQVSPDLTDAHLDAMDIYHGIRAAQLRAFPQFQDIAAEYHKALTHFRTVKPLLTASALEPNLLSSFGNKAEIMQSVRSLLPKETLKEIERYVRAVVVMRGAGKAAVAGAKIGAGSVLTGLGFEGGRRLLGQ